MTMKRPNAFTPLTLRAGPPISPPAAAPALPAAPLIQPLPRHRTWRTMLLGSATFAVAGLLQGTAFAQCDTTPTTGNDTINCTGTIDDTTIDALEGEDSISISSARVGDTGSATITGGQGADVIAVDNITFLGYSSGSQAQILGDAGNDTMTFDYVGVGYGGAATVSGGSGDDSITFTTVGFAVDPGSTAQVLGGEGADEISISSDGGVLGGEGAVTVSGGDGNDLIETNSMVIATDDGSEARIWGDAGNDTIILDDVGLGPRGDATVDGGADADSIILRNDSNLGRFATGSSLIYGNAGNDTITVDNSEIGNLGSATVDGGADNDSITLINSASVGALGVIQGGAGNDTIALDNSVTWNAAASFDGGEGTDTLQFTAAGADTIDASNFAGFENLFKDGSDTLTLTGAHTFSSNVDIDAGTLNVAGSLTTFVADIATGATLQLPGGAFTSVVISDGTITGSATSDDLTFDSYSHFATSNSATSLIQGDGGADTITFSESYIGELGAATVSGGAGADSIQIAQFSFVAELAGSSGTILGDAGNDTIRIDSSTIGVTGNATVDGGADSDRIYLQNNARIGGNAQILGGDGNDTVFLVGPLQIDAGALIDGGLVESNTLDISGSADLTLDGSNFANFDFLDQNGTGTTTLSGSFRLPTKTEINAGTLDIAGSLTTTQTTIASGATLSVSGGTFASEVISDGTITGSATGDALTFNAGSSFATTNGSSSLVQGDAGNDTILLDASLIGGTGGAATVDGGADNDSITLSNGASVGANGRVLGGAGNDTISVDATVTWPGSARIDGGEGTDQFSVDASSPFTLDEGFFKNFERLVKKGTDRFTLLGDHTVSDLVQINAGTLTLGSSAALNTARTEIETGATLELSQRDFASQVISDGTITGSASGDDVTFNAGSQFATTDGATSLIQGDAGNDTFTFDGSFIGESGAATVSGGAGADTINLTNGTYLSNSDTPFSNPSGVILGDAGDDHIIISDSSIGYGSGNATIDAGDDNDSILLQNSTVSRGDILGGDGDDTVALTDSSISYSAVFDGGVGTDEFAFSNASSESLTTTNLTGFETLHKNGTGTLTLTGDHTFGDQVDIDAGTLDLAGTLTTATTTIAPNATLRVSGGAFSSMVTVGGTLTGSAADNDITLSTSSSIGQTAGQIGSVLGDAGADTITLQGTAVGIYGEGRIYGGTGADNISLGNSSDLAYFSTGVGRVGGDAGADTIEITESVVGRIGSATVSGGADEDSIHLSVNAYVGDLIGSSGAIYGDGGADTILIEDASYIGNNGAATVSGGADGDSITLSNRAHLAYSTDATARIDGDAGADTITIVDSYVGRLGDAMVSGGDDADSISLSVSSNLGYYAGGSGQVLGDAGDDTVTLDQTWVGYLGDGTISGGEDNDLLTITGNVSNDFAGIAYQSNSNGRLNGDAGQDTILLNEAPVGFRGSATVDGGADADSISLTSNSDIARFTGSTGLVRGDAGADTIRVDNSYVGWEGSATVSGGDDADSISLATDSNIAVSVGSSSAVYGDSGADTISLDDSFVARAGNATVSGGEDADSISLTNASNIAHDSGSTGIVQGDAGADTITLDDSYVGADGSATISGGADADSISLANNSDIAVNTGSTGLVRGDAGADTIRIDSSYVGWEGSATVSGGDGNDSISLANRSNIGVGTGVSGVVLGDEGADTITIDDSRIGIDGSATVDGGADHDLITLRNG
ncbi:MAG: autotransporter-associated beta strand repeat-containing protein, partial [Pseudomonadota bacterium]